MLAVETTDLSKDFRVGFWRKRPRRALDGVNLSVEAGEVFGLLGPNGAGKSTTIKILLRLLFPTSGAARILGCELDDTAMHARIGYLPENPYFYDQLTAEEFLNYVGALFGTAAPERRKRTRELLDRVGLSESRDVPLRKFSKGMVQRLGIAQAIFNDPELVFLDEPMSGLDPIGRRETRDLILQLKKEGKTIFFSTHILADAESLCDRVGILHQGRLLGCGDLSTILQMETASTDIVVVDPPAEVMGRLTREGYSLVRTGDRVRVVAATESQAAAILEIALQNRIKIVSLNPVKMSLEDYFMARVAEQPSSSPRGEGVAASGGVAKK